MAKPLRSDNPAPPQNVQFSHFGVLDDGKLKKSAFATSIVTTSIVAALLIVITSAVKTVTNIDKKTDIAYVQPPPPPPPPKLPPPPPPKLPPPPPPKLLEPPKIKLEPEKVPDIKPIEVKMAPQPLHLTPAPPKAVTPPPAPKAVSFATPQAAAIRNNDAHPTAVKMGTIDNPLKPLTGPAVAPVNFGNAGARTNAGNTGNGPRSATNVGGFGCPTCTNLAGKDAGSRQVVGVKITSGGTGPLNSKNLNGEPVNVHLQTLAPTQLPPPPTLHAASAAAPPKLLSKPTPVYTDEAKQLHLEGAVTIRIHVSTTGTVSVLGVAHGLGHGLDQAALRAAQGMRFSPALDSSGHPVDWEGVVNVNFQMAG
jgi:periplasmic protein TonB